MNKWRSRVLFFLIGVVAFSAHSSEYRVIDSNGVESRFSNIPKRIIPLEPALAELVLRLGVPVEKISGVSTYTDFPPELKKKPSVGPFLKPNLEIIVGLKPDLIFASREGTPPDLIIRLRKMGFSVVVLSTESISDLRNAYRIIGHSVGKINEANSALLDFDQAIKKLKDRTNRRRVRKVLIQVGVDPLVVAAGKTFLSEGLQIIGAENIYPDLNQSYPRVGIEDVLKKNPEVIILTGMGEDRLAFKQAESRWRSFPSLAAVKNNRIHLLTSDALLRPGPRFPDGLRELEKAVYETKEEK